MPAASRFSILAVDDNPLNLKLLEMSLGKEGYRILTAADGPAAREIAATEKPDLILLDIIMPGENGFDVIKHLKSNSATASIPVIFLTGINEIDYKLAGFKLGAVDYITKPFHPLEVLARVRLHLKLSIATNSLIASQAQKLKEITEAQTSLLTTPDSHPKAHFGVYYLTLHEAGGDFYEVLPISENIYGYVVADFSGHDIKTSYMIASIKALLKQNCRPVYGPVESIRMINDVLVEILPEGKYLTTCYGKLNRKTNQMTIVNAGHPPAVYVPVKGEPSFVEISGDILGVFKDVWFGQKNIDVSPGDRFYLYSDGLVESCRQKIMWTQAQQDLIAACNKVRDISIREAPGKIVQLLHKEVFQPEDDIVILGIEV